MEVEPAKSCMALPTEIADDVVSVYQSEYKELCGNWSAVESKAQMTAVSAGILLSGTMAFLGLGLCDIPAYAYAFFPLIAVSLSLSGFCSLKALWITGANLPPAGEDLKSIAEGIQHDNELAWIEKYKVRATQQKIFDWDDACEDVSKLLEKKGTWVIRAQKWLVVTAALVLTFVLVVVSCQLK